jgi:hypothetical protein
MTNLANHPAHSTRVQNLHGALQSWMTRQGDQGDATERAAFTRMPTKR